jgi:hypothetical protein
MFALTNHNREKCFAGLSYLGKSVAEKMSVSNICFKPRHVVMCTIFSSTRLLKIPPLDKIGMVWLKNGLTAKSMISTTTNL